MFKRTGIQKTLVTDLDQVLSVRPVNLIVRVAGCRDDDLDDINPRLSWSQIGQGLNHGQEAFDEIVAIRENRR